MFQIIWVTALLFLCCVKQEPVVEGEARSNPSSTESSDNHDDEEFEELMVEFQQLVSKLATDSRRKNERFADVFERMRTADRDSTKRSLTNLISTGKLKLKENHHCSVEERNNALPRLRLLDFFIDPIIAPRDVREIVAYIEANEFLDTRVLAFRRIDQDTVEVTTGVVQGPLSGSGHRFIARRENGVWIVRYSSTWVS